MNNYNMNFGSARMAPMAGAGAAQMGTGGGFGVQAGFSAGGSAPSGQTGAVALIAWIAVMAGFYLATRKFQGSLSV